MCTDCQQRLDHQAAYFQGHIASLNDALRVGSDEAWDTSEPFCVGGLGSASGNIYTCRAPYVGDCEFCVDIGTCGATSAQVLVSSTRKNSGIDFTGVNVQGYNDSQMDGLVINLPASTTIPIDSQWYQVRNSENTVYVLVICSTNSAVVNIQFRQKRK